MRITRRTVSKAFRERILNEWPILRKNRAYRRFIQYLLFGNYRDDRGYLIISQEVLAQLEEKESELSRKKYKGETFLVNVKRDVLPDLEWSKWDSTEKKARVVLNDGIPDYIHDLANDENLLSHVEYVYFDSGEVYNNRKARKEREDLSVIARELLKDTKESRRLLEYMGDVPQQQFTQIVDKNMTAAIETAMSLPHEKYHRELSLLRGIKQQCRPFYKPVADSNRIYSLNESIPMLKREVRKSLTRGWIEFDIKSAHLAINAYLWNCEVVKEFLRSGKSIWRELLEYLGIEDTTVNRNAIKKALYSLVYGKRERDIEAQFPGFIQHYVIADLLAGRKRAVAEVRKNRGGYSAFGEWITRNRIDEWTINEILATISQSYELRLLLPVLELAEKNKDEFWITLWQHDGFSVSVLRSSRNEYWKDKIKEVFHDNLIREYGHELITELEYS